MTDVILSIDEGTTNVKGVYINRAGVIVAKSSRSLLMSHPQQGYSEQDPEQILICLQDIISQLINEYPNYHIKGLSISNQRESFIIWDKISGQALTPLVSWQCRRSASYCQKLIESGYQEKVFSITGLFLDPLFPATKIRDVLEKNPLIQKKVEQGELCIGTIDSWLLWHLTNGKEFSTDISNASRTALLNLKTRKWDEELLSLFEIPSYCLPSIRKTSDYHGQTDNFLPLPNGIPILCMIGDSHAALFGHGGFEYGKIKATYGTGSSLMSAINEISFDSEKRLSTTVAWQEIDENIPVYALEGNIIHAGSCVSWMQDLIDKKDYFLLENIEEFAPNNGGVFFVPALSGLGAPHWNNNAKGLIKGLSESTQREHLVRASLEAIAYQVKDVFDVMQKNHNNSISELLVDGGPTSNQWLMQFQADLLNIPIKKSELTEMSATGAAYLAGIMLGWWKDKSDILSIIPSPTIFEPRDKTDLSEDYEQWKLAVQQTMVNLNY